MSKYGVKLKDPRWQQVRLRVMNRDEWKCRDCGCADKTLHVHHCFYEKGDPWETSDEFLLTLCEECHQSRGDLEADAKKALARIMSKMKHCHNSPDQLSVFAHSLVRATDNNYKPLILDEHEFQCIMDSLEKDRKS